MRIEMVWLVGALVLAGCGKKSASNADKADREGEAECNSLASAVEREACLTEFHKRGKTTEASLNLNKLGKAAKRVRAETGKYPIGDAQHPRHAGGTCCGDGTPVDNRCHVEASEFAKDPVWAKLDFAVDPPTVYTYEYHSTDGDSFTAYAIGDADCDTKLATFTMQGAVTSKGNPATNIIPPPSGVY